MIGPVEAGISERCISAWVYIPKRLRKWEVEEDERAMRERKVRQTNGKRRDSRG